MTKVHTNIEHISLSDLADYAAGRVFARTTSIELEQHLLLCGDCQTVVVKLDSDASSGGRTLDITHATADGLVRLWVERSSMSGRWMARYTGGQLKLMEDKNSELGKVRGRSPCDPSMRCSLNTYVPTPARSRLRVAANCIWWSK